MNKNSVVLLVVGAVLLGLIAESMAVRGNEVQSDVVWEYKTLRFSGPLSGAEHALNECGKKGWEVVDWEDSNYGYILLKRQL